MNYKLLVAALTFLTATALASRFDTGWITFTQPNGATFVARLFGDEYEYRFETKDGYSLQKNYEDGYYYYAREVWFGRFVLSSLRVAIDEPVGIPKSLTAKDPERERPTIPEGTLGVQGPSLKFTESTVTTITLKVLLVEFQDFYGRTTYTRSNFQNMLSGSNYTVSPDGDQAFGSIKYYWERMSNGQLIVNATILNSSAGGDVPNWVRLPQNKSYYQNGSLSTFDNAAYNAGVAAGYDLSTNATTKLVYIFAGNRLEGGLTPHASGSTYTMSERWGGRGHYEDDPTHNHPFAHIGVHCHEFGHVLGFPDIYYWNHIDWSLMADGCDMGPNAKGECPTPLDPHHRYTKNWITVQTPPTPNSGVSLVYNEVTPTVYRVVSGSDIYYFENRRYQDFGSYSPGYTSGGGGIFVWHVLGSTVQMIPADGTGFPNEGYGDLWPGGTSNRNVNDFTTVHSKKFDGTNSNVIMHSVSDPGTTMTAVIGSKWFGNLPSNLTWSGNVIVGSALTVPSSTTLTVQSGSTVLVDPGISFTVNGTLNAYETTFYFANSNPFSGTGKLIVNGMLSANNTLFSSASHWGGISFTSNSDGYLNECMITNVETYGGSAISINNASPTIQYCTIANNIGDCSGVNVVSDASPYFRYNTIQNNSRHGIRIYDAWAALQYNNITGATGSGKAAVMVDGLSGPLFGATSSPFEGKNTLTGGYYGIAATYYSNPTIGGSSVGRNNRLFGNSYADAWANYNSTIYATYDWWGQSPPNTSKIIATSGTTIYYNPWLTSDPGPAFKIQQGEEPAPVTPALSILTSSSDRQTALWQAKEEQLQNRYGNAIDIYKNIIYTGLESNEAATALAELGNVYRESRSQEVFSIIKPYAERANPLQAIALMVLAKCQKLDGNKSDAAANYERVISNFADTEHERYARLNRFFLYLNSKQYDAARSELTVLQAKYPAQEMTVVASWYMQTEDPTSAEERQPKQIYSEKQVSSEDLEVGLNIYPNPFNPTTQMRFSIKDAGYVSLKVYDLLGREVAVLVNEEKQPGAYSVEWNAGHLPSGMYFSRLESGGRAIIQKLLLVR